LAGDVLTAAHQPVPASVGNPFVIAEVTPEALSRARPDLAAFGRARDSRPEMGGRFALYLYARGEEADALRARMFGPLSGTWEDPATGSAAAPLAALLLSLSEAAEGRWRVAQGVEMGRPSLLSVSARRVAEGIRATVGGRCVPVLRGEALL
jgi:trans-2,3-dihydro-3-hydroxyanthranilate isomerase